jgi:hypothetical protein
MWLRGELVGDGGDAIVCSARALVGITDAELEARFRDLRNADYREILGTAEALASAGVGVEMGRELARLRRRVDEVSKVDFFTSPVQAEALRALDQLAAVAAGSTPSAARAEQGSHNGRTWVTRTGVFVDRMASAWLIRRFIDRRATFRFTSEASYSPKANELRFDMFHGEFTHEGDRCTFETLLARFGLDDPALHAIAEIVHDIDCKDEKFGRSESAGVELVLRGLVGAEPDDSRRIERGSAIFDALFAQLGGASNG